MKLLYTLHALLTATCLAIIACAVFTLTGSALTAAGTLAAIWLLMPYRT